MIFGRLIIHGSKTCLDREDAAWEIDKGITLGKHQHCEVLVPHMMPVILSPGDDDVSFSLFFKDFDNDSGSATSGPCWRSCAWSA